MKKILALSDSPPVISFTFCKMNGVTSAPDIDNDLERITSKKLDITELL